MNSGEWNMSRGVLGKNNWALVLLILVGVVLGGLIGKLCAGVPALSWLSYGQSFGFVNPMVLDLGIFSSHIWIYG